jgi:hypothetical protein
MVIINLNIVDIVKKVLNQMNTIRYIIKIIILPSLITIPSNPSNLQQNHFLINH